MSRLLGAVLLIVAVGGCASTPRRYACRFVEHAPVIDGELDDAAWRAAGWTTDFVDICGPKTPAPRFRTRARLAWDNTNLYIAADMQEPHVNAALTAHDAVVYHDNDFEIFIDPDGDARNYFEIEVNALNTIFDLLLVRTYRDGGPAEHGWDASGLRSAIHVTGTLNDARDIDEGWSVEMAIPWAALAAKAGTPCPPRNGDVWRMNFSRVEWRYGTRGEQYEKTPNLREDNWVWSPQGEVNMHIPQRWGFVRFVR